MDRTPASRAGVAGRHAVARLVDGHGACGQGAIAEDDHPIDGRDITALFENPGAGRSPHEAYFFYWGNDLHAVRSGPWCLHMPHSYRSLKGEPGQDGLPGPYVQKKTGLSGKDLGRLQVDEGKLIHYVYLNKEDTKFYAGGWESNRILQFDLTLGGDQVIENALPADWRFPTYA